MQVKPACGWLCVIWQPDGKCKRRHLLALEGAIARSTTGPVSTKMPEIPRKTTNMYVKIKNNSRNPIYSYFADLKQKN